MKQTKAFVGVGLQAIGLVGGFVCAALFGLDAYDNATTVGLIGFAAGTFLFAIGYLLAFGKPPPSDSD